MRGLSRGTPTLALKFRCVRIITPPGWIEHLDRRRKGAGLAARRPDHGRLGGGRTNAVVADGWTADAGGPDHELGAHAGSGDGQCKATFSSLLCWRL